MRLSLKDVSAPGRAGNRKRGHGCRRLRGACNNNNNNNNNNMIMITLSAQLLRKEYGDFPIDLPQLRTSMMMLCSIACSSRVLSCALLQSAK